MRAWIKSKWTQFRSPSTRWAAGTLVVGGLFFGAAGWMGFETVIHQTNTLAFCTSCHEMQAYVYQEYTQSPHYSNHSGVQAICSDCHVPRAMVPKLIRKIQASYNELPRHLLGTIDTPEAFEARRPALAEHVWAAMKANDSRECRECHNAASMALDKQKPRARGQHEAAKTSGETCIDCHKGIAHTLPKQDEPAPAEDDFSL